MFFWSGLLSSSTLLNMDVGISVLWLVNFPGVRWFWLAVWFSFLFSFVVGSLCFLSLPVSDLHCMVDVGILCTLQFVSHLCNILSFLLERNGVG